MASIKEYMPTSYRAGALVVVICTGAMTAAGTLAGMIIGNIHPLAPAVLFGAPTLAFTLLSVFDPIMEERVEWRKHLAAPQRIPELPPVQQYSYVRANGHEPADKFEQRAYVDNRSLVHPNIPQIVTVSQMRRYAHGILLEHAELSHGVWASHKSSLKTFSQPQYRELQKYLRGYGLIEEEGGYRQNGYQLTSAGRRWLEDILRAYPAPLRN